MRPSLPLPEPLRAVERPSFTHYSVVVRLVDIARRALIENTFPPQTKQRLQALIDEIPLTPIRHLDTPNACDNAEWKEYINRYAGMNWLEIPWFFAEEYFYRRILEASGYFRPGEWQKVDPYIYQKSLGLETTREDVRVLAEQLLLALQLPAQAKRDSLSRILLVDLWGNQNDLSLFPVRTGANGEALTKVTPPGGASQEQLEAARAHLLVDDTPALLNYMNSLHHHGPIRMDILLDNAGYELVADLTLADFLLEAGFASQVVLHAKPYPVFVSDALKKDIHQTLDFLVLSEHAPVKELAIRLRTSLVADRLVLRQHDFWTSPLPFWEMPPALLDDLSSSTLLISKGDANYRRLLGDLHWPMDLPFQQVVSGYPFGILALRTLKSEIALGIAPAVIPTTEPDWMINGRWGLIQFSSPV